MPLSKLQSKFNIILASKSPRRQQLLSDLGLRFEVQTREVEEVYPEHLTRAAIAEYLAELKASMFEDLDQKQLLITSDTIVCVDEQVLGKPKDRNDAIAMLQLLSGRSHSVISGVCFKTASTINTFSDTTQVHVKTLSQQESEYDVDNVKPYDKAGSYGIQEWIGYIGIEGIEGDYFNVMGLPVRRVYAELQRLSEG
jgi:septum formation protein